MKTQLRLLAISYLLTFICQSAHAQGALTPPGEPVPTMKTLTQIEPRTPISAVPFTISVPGSYYLTTNVTTTVSNAIVIAVSGVTLDLSGFTIASTVASAANGGTAILLGGGLSDLTIGNGHIRSGVTSNGSGTYSGSGFYNGIVPSGSSPVNTRISGVSVAGCLNRGIYLTTADSTLVEACTVRTMGGNGISASTIKSCVAVDCGGYGIFGDQVSDSRGEARGGTGLSATTAQNCFGNSSSNYGLYAASTANDCGGSSSTGTGLYAYNASFCTGFRSGGTAIQATIATGCIAQSGTNIITYKYNMP